MALGTPLLVSAAALAALALPDAAPDATPSAAPHRAEPVAAVTPACRGRLSPSASSARFLVDVRLPLRAEGRFTDISGELLPVHDGGCEVHVRLRADTVAYEGPDWMADLTRSPAFLDADAHPEVAFDAQAFPATWLADGGPIRGRLRLRGRERPVEFALRPAACPRPGADCPIVVVGEVNRRDFGMQAYRFTVRDAVRFEFRIRLETAR